jgi:AcrR family transcriptional regulator
MPADKQQIPSVWTRPRRQREQPALSQERIVSEAVQLLDAEGLEALSMRSLGTRLGAGATSLYRHVANKDELIELVVDEVYGELEVPEPGDPEGWRTSFGRVAYSLRWMILRHPWVASVLGQVGLAYLGPNLIRLSNSMLALTTDAGFALDEADLVMKTLMAYVIGWVTSEAAYLSMIVRSGQTESEWLASLQSAAEEAFQDQPQLKDGLGVPVGKDPQQLRDDTFDYGLQRVLDGLQFRRES